MSHLTQSGMPKGKPFPENELVWLDCPECEYHVRVHQSTQEANMRQHKEKGCPLVTTGDETPEVEDRSPLELQAPLCPEPCGNACTCVSTSEPLSRDPSLPVEPTPSHSWEPLRKALSGSVFEQDVAAIRETEEGRKAFDEEVDRVRQIATEAPTILEEAGELVDGPREAHYGHPYDDFSRAIGAFNALFEDYLKQPLEVRHWPLIMQLVKLSREINEPKRDNWVDGAGYWRTLEKVMNHADEGQYR